MKGRKSIKEFLLRNKYFLGLLVLFIVVSFYKFSEEKIIRLNDDYIFYIGMVLFILVSTVTFYFKKYKREILIELSLFWGLILGFLFFTTINYMNIRSSNINSSIQEIGCEFKGTTTSRMSRGFYFSFKERTKFISGFYDFMNKLESKNYKNDLVLIVKFSKGWQDSYIIHSWKVRNK